MLLSEAGRMGKGIEEEKRILPHLFLEGTQSPEEKSSFSDNLKKLDLKVYKPAGK